MVAEGSTACGYWLEFSSEIQSNSSKWTCRRLSSQGDCQVAPIDLPA
jgi:hypothetical protein